MAADTPESLVFGGREGSGAAQVFGHPYDVVNMYRQGEAEKRRRADIQQAMAFKAKQDRDKKVSELLLTNPDKTFEPFKQQVVQAAEKHRTAAVDIIDKGIDPDASHFKLWNKTGWDKVNAVANRGNIIEKIVTDKRSEVAANKYLDKDIIDSAISDTYMNEKGEGHPIESIDLKKIGGVVDNNPQAFKANVYGTDFLKDLGNTVFKYNELQRNNEGVSTEGYVEKLKKGIYQQDPNAADGILRDPKTGAAVINITPEVVQAFKADKNAANWVRYQSEKTGLSEKDVIQNVLAPKVGEDRQHISGFKYAPTNANLGNGNQSSVVGSGDNALRPYEQIGSDKKVGFDSISFGYSADKEMPISSTQGGSADQTGKFSGLRANPSTGKKEMEFVTNKHGKKGIKYVPYDEKTFEQVMNSLPPKKRVELKKLKTDFDNKFETKKEYVLDDQKLNTDVDAISDYYNKNKDAVGTDSFNNGFSQLINELGLDKNVKSNKTFWWFNPNEITIGDQTVKAGDKEKMKEVIYNLQKGKYKKEAGSVEGMAGDKGKEELGTIWPQK